MRRIAWKCGLLGVSASFLLSILGSGPSSDDKITAAIKTAAAPDCCATTCITALTVQKTERVFSVDAVQVKAVRNTVYEIAQDFPRRP
jgi:hydroxymethylpyrimidine/phosphomethylpyrimidine kinase